MTNEDRARYISNCIWHILRDCEDGKDYNNRLQEIGTAIAFGASAQGVHQRLLNLTKKYEAKRKPTGDQ
jgi:hypothetical protein